MMENLSKGMNLDKINFCGKFGLSKWHRKSCMLIILRCVLLIVNKLVDEVWIFRNFQSLGEEKTYREAFEGFNSISCPSLTKAQLFPLENSKTYVFLEEIGK